MKTLTPFLSNSFFTNSPFSNLQSRKDLWSEMDQVFDQLATVALPIYQDSAWTNKEFTPASELVEDENQFMLTIDLPGLKKEDIKIEMNDKTLSISGERKREVRHENQHVHRLEKNYGFFKRSFILPNTVQSDKIEARFENGVLELTLPKTAIAAARKIEIQ